MSFGGYNPGRQQDLPFSNTSGAPTHPPPPNSTTMRSRTGSFSSNPAPPPPPPSSQQQQQQQHGSPYSAQPSTPTSRGEGFYSGVGLNIHTAGYGSGGYTNNNINTGATGYGSRPGSPSTMSSPYPTGGVTAGPSTLPAYSRNSGGASGNASGLDDGGYSSGYDSPSGISTSVPYSFNTNNGLHRPHPQHPQHQHQHQQQQQHISSYQTTTTTRQSAQRLYPRSHSRTHSNASETSLNIDTGVDTTLYSPGPVSLSSASSSRRGSFSDAPGGVGTNSGTGFFARQRTYRPSTAGAVSDADDDLDMDLGNKNSPRRHRQKRMSKKSSSNRNLLGAVSGMGGGKSSSSGSRMSGILNDWDMLLPSGDPYDDMDEDEEGGDDGMNENERWKKKQLTKRGWESQRGQGIILGLVVMVAVFVRIWKLAVPGAVVSEEQRLGGHIRDYLQGNFVVDVHPPLGKMLFSLVAYLLGYDGKFDFMLGKLYPSNVPFIGMRMFAAACGVGLIPISYLTIKRSGHSTQAAITCAILVTFENALITQNRFMTLDAPMMLFMGYTLLAWVNFYNHRNRPFTRGWWTWLLQTGVGLFLSSSVKWVGSFTIVTIGLCVLKYLQESRKHLYLSTRDFSKQITALSLCLIVLPVLLYMGLYAIDFQLLSNSGLGDSWVSPQFRMTLKGHDVEPVMTDIAWQSKIHIRHANSNGGWVHSTPGEYARDGTIDQAIQLVEWDDDLTCWQVHPSDTTARDRQSKNHIDREKNPTSVAFDGYIYDGDLVRLRHCYTKVALSVHNLESIGSNKSFIKEVRGIQWAKELPSAQEQETVWRVELVPEGTVPGLVTAAAKQPVADGSEDVEAKKEQREQWHSIKGFRLFSEQQNCYLMSHKVFRSTYSSYQEVGCIQDSRQKGDTIFVVDRNVNPHLPASTPSHSYQPLTFLQKFIEINKVMWWSHHDLASPLHSNSHTDDYSPTTKGGSKSRKSDASHPWSWLFLGRGLNYYSSKETNNYVYLLGNPILWWAASSTAVFYVLGCAWSVLGSLRGKSKSLQNQPRARFGLTPFYTIAPGTFCAGWFIHYAPYFFLSSTSSSASFFSATYGSHLYLHNYLPALYFSILLLISRLDRIWQQWSSRKLRYTVGFTFILIVILAWYSLSPLAYGTDFSSRKACEQARSVGGWEFVCRRQNLPLARPQDAIARIVVEQRADHEEHQEREEAENSQFYYQAPVTGDTAGEHDHDHDHKHEQHNHHHDHRSGENEGEVHDHEGPFNEDEREHYDHEHFHHPPGHQHSDLNDHGHHHHGHGHAIHNPASEHHHHHHDHHDHHTPSSSSPPAQGEGETEQDDTKKAAKQERMDKMWAAAAHHADTQKEKLVAEKLALEARQRELEEQLRVQEQVEQMELELERQRVAAAHQEQEKKEEEAKEQRLREEREQRDREVQEQQERQQRAEQERQQREEQERQQREEQERQQREEQERQQREEQERQQHEEQERHQREEQERRQREEQEHRQREEQLRLEREAQELQLQHHQQQQDRDQEQQERERLERQAAEQEVAAATEATTAEEEEKDEAAKKEKMTRQMLEEQVRVLQAQVDSHRERSINMAQLQDPHQQHLQQQQQQQQQVQQPA
ncbi:MAG: Dolichyl-phosphate-mannose-protein mannosyltransferase-domain-containing protein [Linnemannia gamsii]|nr:MAG: Dolichyl-phosphate-mannose-protein mannosyltransferase-domain-containing protein [Linnemannia gamsii]